MPFYSLSSYAVGHDRSSIWAVCEEAHLPEEHLFLDPESHTELYPSCQNCKHGTCRVNDLLSRSSQFRDQYHAALLRCLLLVLSRSFAEVVCGRRQGTSLNTMVPKPRLPTLPILATDAVTDSADLASPQVTPPFV